MHLTQNYVYFWVLYFHIQIPVFFYKKLSGSFWWIWWLLFFNYSWSDITIPEVNSTISLCFFIYTTKFIYNLIACYCTLKCSTIVHKIKNVIFKWNCKSSFCMVESNSNWSVASISIILFNSRSDFSSRNSKKLMQNECYYLLQI